MCEWIRPLQLNRLTLPNNVFLAPMAGYTDFAFRGICSRYGAGLTVTELISAKGLINKNPGTALLLKTDGSEKVKCAQIFGSDPEIMRRACESAELSAFDVIDINMGCPVPKIVKNGEGCALMGNPLLAQKIVKECVKSGKTVTAKIRTGLTREKPVTAEFCKVLQDGGVSMITVHGRSREMYYSGEVMYGEIAEAKRAVCVPVIANGGITDAESADLLIGRTGADGVMVGTAALGKPYIFSEILGLPYGFELKNAVTEHIDALLGVYPDAFVAVIFRKFLTRYLKNSGVPKPEKQKLLLCDSTDGIKEILNSVL